MRSQLRTVFLEIVQDMKKKRPFFGVNYNSVTQKLRILAIKAIFDPKSNFLTDSIEDSIKIKAEITSFNIKKSKLRAVAGVEGFWVAELHVRQLKIGTGKSFSEALILASVNP